MGMSEPRVASFDAPDGEVATAVVGYQTLAVEIPPNLLYNIVRLTHYWYSLYAADTPVRC
jgi:hypothetical protein